MTKRTTELVTATVSPEAYAMLEEMREVRRNKNRSEVVEDAIRLYYAEVFNAGDRKARGSVKIQDRVRKPL